jgi:hypothetical protein
MVVIFLFCFLLFDVFNCCTRPAEHQLCLLPSQFVHQCLWALQPACKTTPSLSFRSMPWTHAPMRPFKQEAKLEQSTDQFTISRINHMIKHQMTPSDARDKQN